MKEKINWTLNLFTPMLSLIILTLKSPYRYAAGPSSININGSCSWQWLVEVAFHNSDAGIKRQTWEGRSRATVFAQPAGWRPLGECCSRLPLAKCGDSGAARELPTAPRKSMGFKTKSGNSNTWIRVIWAQQGLNTIMSAFLMAGAAGCEAQKKWLLRGLMKWQGYLNTGGSK